MSDTYNNVPMSDAMAARTEKEDAFWTGPRLIVLSFVTLAAAFALLWSMSEGIIGPTQHDGEDSELMVDGPPQHVRTLEKDESAGIRGEQLHQF